MADDFAVNGFLLIDKPAGITSQQAVIRVKKALGVRRVGHGGTLDPMATGLLIIGIGRATRLLGYISDKTKQYEATIRLGQAMTTDDADGDPLGEIVDATAMLDDTIKAAISAYVGDIDQIPSAVSAVKIDGKPAYARVRAGEEVQLKARRVTVTRFELMGRTDFAPWVALDVQVDCSSGTYVRALARDLGRDLGCGAHLSALRRTKIGEIAIAEAKTIDEVTLDDVIDMGEMAKHIAPAAQVDESHLHDIAVGRPIAMEVPSDPTAVFFGQRLLALYRQDPYDRDKALPVAVFITPSDHIRTRGRSSLVDPVKEEGGA
ncbi:MAG: tRNA pseudouridine(55) synthase TruB [Propionibacteriaceae bacterium]|nr:tRNA pseudouridine(55) synthase TruB [Propionibacteriaceae bacterium]